MEPHLRPVLRLWRRGRKGVACSARVGHGAGGAGEGFQDLTGAQGFRQVHAQVKGRCTQSGARSQVHVGRCTYRQIRQVHTQAGERRGSGRFMHRCGQRALKGCKHAQVVGKGHSRGASTHRSWARGIQGVQARTGHGQGAFKGCKHAPCAVVPQAEGEVLQPTCLHCAQQHRVHRQRARRTRRPRLRYQLHLPQ